MTIRSIEFEPPLPFELEQDDLDGVAQIIAEHKDLAKKLPLGENDVTPKAHAGFLQCTVDVYNSKNNNDEHGIYKSRYEGKLLEEVRLPEDLRFYPVLINQGGSVELHGLVFHAESIPTPPQSESFQEGLKPAVSTNSEKVLVGAGKQA